MNIPHLKKCPLFVYSIQYSTHTVQIQIQYTADFVRTIGPPLRQEMSLVCIQYTADFVRTIGPPLYIEVKYEYIIVPISVNYLGLM